jgi:hypothetical protein
MDIRFDALLAAIARAGEPAPADLVTALRSLPGPGMLPSPWETWTLIGLVRYRERQRWVADFVRDRLRGAPSDLTVGGALGQPGVHAVHDVGGDLHE